MILQTSLSSSHLSSLTYIFQPSVQLKQSPSAKNLVGNKVETYHNYQKQSLSPLQSLSLVETNLAMSLYSLKKVFSLSNVSCPNPKTGAINNKSSSFFIVLFLILLILYNLITHFFVLYFIKCFNYVSSRRKVRHINCVACKRHYFITCHIVYFYVVLFIAV